MTVHRCRSNCCYDPYESSKNCLYFLVFSNKINKKTWHLLKYPAINVIWSETYTGAQLFKSRKRSDVTLNFSLKHRVCKVSRSMFPTDIKLLKLINLARLSEKLSIFRQFRNRNPWCFAASRTLTWRGSRYIVEFSWEHQCEL